MQKLLRQQVCHRNREEETHKEPLQLHDSPLQHLNSSFEVTFFVLWLGKMLIEPIFFDLTNDYTSHIINDYALGMMQCCFFFVGFIDAKAKEIVLQPKRVGWKYLKTFFLLNLMACKLFHVITQNSQAPYEYLCSKILELVTYLHVPCLYIRLNTVLDYLDNMGQMMKLEGE